MRNHFFLILISIFGTCWATPALSAHYNVLAIRVEFPFEEPDHETTTGRGTFDLRDFYAPENDELRGQYFNPWDVPPHNRTYFENHLLALSNYWQTVSDGLVTISADVYPKNQDDAYRMSKIFYKYGNGRTKEQTYQKLVDLLIEAIQVCNDTEGSSIDISSYDTIMVIHAGIGSETSGELNDIPSAYISSDDILNYHGKPLVINGTAINHGIVIPEMTAANGVGGLNGIIAQMFGHRLGLPSMSNNDIGMPAAGGWCLMDTGAMSWGWRTRGFVPTHPCAWSKIELGWIEPVVVTRDTTITIAATHIKNEFPRAIKIPITEDEYFLLENRRNYAPRDSLASATYSDSDSSGVWIKPEHYDAYIPGSGVLVWQINDKIIRDNRADGTINDDSFRRGIDLVEADGRQDIGALFGIGDSRAEYNEGHEDDTYKISGKNILGPDTFPSSESLWGGDTGITINVLSDVSDTMTVSISFNTHIAGFPISITDAENITAADLDNDGIDELVVSTPDSAYVLTSGGIIVGGFPSSGHPALAQSPSGNTSLLSAHENTMSYYSFNNGSLSLDWTTEFPEHQFRSDNCIILSDPSGSSWATATDNSESGDTSYLLSADDNHAAIRLPETGGLRGFSLINGQFASVGSNALIIGSLGAETNSFPLSDTLTSSPVILDIDRDNEYETVIASGQELRFIEDDLSYESCYLEESPSGELSVADIDQDGYPEIIIASGKHIYSYRNNGVLSSGFPFVLPPGDNDETIVTSPLIADLDNDGNDDILAVTSNMRIIAWNKNGSPISGFPLTLAAKPSAPPALIVNSEGEQSIAYLTDAGLIYARSLSTPSIDTMNSWTMLGGGPGLSGSFANDRIENPVQNVSSFHAICYPNPITGGQATFRITAPEKTDCTVELFSADGRKVYDSHISENDIVPGVPNEIHMNSNSLSSGLYIARITTRHDMAIIKVGVLK